MDQTPNQELETSAVVPAEQEVTTPAEPTAPSASEDTKHLQELEELRSTLQKAEHTIVKLKKEAKGEVEEQPADVDLDSKIEEMLERKLAARLQTEDQEVSELQKAQQKIKEMAEAMKSRQSQTSASVGTNQDRQVAEPELKLNAQEEELLSRAAARAGLSLTEFVKKKKLNL